MSNVLIADGNSKSYTPIRKCVLIFSGEISLHTRLFACRIFGSGLFDFPQIVYIISMESEECIQRMRFTYGDRSDLGLQIYAPDKIENEIFLCRNEKRK